MTGVNINNNLNIDNNIIENNQAVNAENRIDNRPQGNIAVRPEGGNQNLEIQARNNEVRNTADKYPMASPSMAQKFSGIESRVKDAADGKKDMTLGDLMKLLQDHSENRKGSRMLFTDARGAMNLDKFAGEMVKSLVNTYCFGNHRELPEEAAQLKADMTELLDEIMKGSYRSENRDQIKSRLSGIAERLSAHVNNQGALSPEAKERALTLVSDIRKKYTDIIDNRFELKHKVLRSMESNVKISFKSAEELVGMGTLLQKCEHYLTGIGKKADLGIFFDLPSLDAQKMVNQFASGETSFREIMDSDDKDPRTLSLLRDFSRNSLKRFRLELQGLDNARDSINEKKTAVLNDIRNHGMADEGTKKAVTDFSNTILGRIKELNLIKEDAASYLSEADEETLYAGAGKDHDSRISAEVATFREVLNTIKAGTGDNLARLAEGNGALFAHVLKTVDYSPMLLQRLMKTPEFTDSLLRLETEHLSDNEVRECINNISSALITAKVSDSAMLSELLSGVSRDNLSESAAFIMDHLPRKLELTNDVLTCINLIINDDPAADRKTSMNITMNDLKTAYQKICSPGNNLARVLKNNNCFNDLRTVENIIIKAAYHQYLADHPTAQDAEQGRHGDFRSNAGFREEMGIADNHADAVNGRVYIGRYDGFDPVTVNTKNTEMTTFLKFFNLAMHHSDFAASCGKLSAVHVTQRIAEAMGPKALEFMNGAENVFKNQDGIGEEDKQKFDNLRNELRGCQSGGEVLKLLEKDENMAILTSIFIASQKTTLDQIHENNVEKLNSGREVINNLHLNDLVQFSHKSAAALGTEAKEIASVEELLKDVSKLKGSQGLGILAASLETLGARTILDILPKGQTCFGISAEDFKNPAKITAIRDALKSVPPELRESSDFKFAFMTYVKLRALSRESKELKTAEDLINARPEKAEFEFRLLEVAYQGPAGNKNNVVNNDLGEFTVLTENYYDDQSIISFCMNKSQVSKNACLTALNNLKLTDEMFVPENNIFVENEKEGAQLKKDLQIFIDSARKELGKKRARPDQIMRELYTRVSAKLAQDRTHNISSALMYLSPYFETEFSNGSGRSLEQKLTKTLNEIFPSDKAAVSELKSALVSTTAGQSRALSELMTGFRKNSKADDARVSELLNNDFVSLLAEKALRKVAYDNKFKTYADFKYDFSNNTELNGKTRDALIKEAARNLKADLAVDDVVLEKMMRQLTSSDLYSNDTSSKSTHAKRALRYAGRAIRSSRVANGISNFFKGIKSFFTSRKDPKVYEAISGKVLTSLGNGEMLVHTKDNRITLEAGKNFDVGKLQVGARARLSLGAGSNFEIERLEEGGYTFRMSANISAGSGAGGTIGTVKDPTVAAEAGLNGKYQKTYAVTLDEEEAADFLARIMAGRLKRSDFQKAKDLRTETAKSFDFETSAEAGIKGTKQVIQGKDDTSMYDPWQFSASADLEFSKEWLRETGGTTQTFTKNTSFSVSAGVEASFSLKNQLLDGANPDEMKDKAQDKISEHKEKAGLDEDDEITLGDLPDEALKGTEIKNYNDKAKDIDSWNKLTHFFTDHKKALSDQGFNKYIVDKFSSHKYLPTDKQEWNWKDDVEKWEFDRNRFIAESLVNFVSTNITNNAVADMDDFVNWLGNKIPVVKQMNNFVKTVKGLVSSFEGLISRLDTAHLRFNLDIEAGTDANELLRISAGVTYQCDDTRTFETNLLQNDLKKVDRHTVITPETNGGDSNVMTKNIKFLTKTMKQYGFTKRQMDKAIARLNLIQNNGENLESMEIVRTGKKSALARIRKELGNTEKGNLANKIGKKVDAMKDEDFLPLKIVFNTTRKIDATAAKISVGGVFKASISSEESLVKNNSYEVEF